MFPTPLPLRSSPRTTTAAATNRREPRGASFATVLGLEARNEIARPIKRTAVRAARALVRVSVSAVRAAARFVRALVVGLARALRAVVGEVCSEACELARPYVRLWQRFWLNTVAHPLVHLWLVHVANPAARVWALLLELQRDLVLYERSGLAF